MLVTDRQQARGRLEEAVEAALVAGCRWISVREKDLPQDELEGLVRRLLPLTERHEARLGLHGEASAAHALGLRALHLAAGSNAATARAMLGGGALIGISVHSTDELVALASEAVDYVVCGPAYATASKPGYGPALEVAGVTAAAAAATVPLLAIGGITPDNLGRMLKAGAAGVAVMGSIMRADDPGAEMRRLLAAIPDQRAR